MFLTVSLRFQKKRQLQYALKHLKLSPFLTVNLSTATTFLAPQGRPWVLPGRQSLALCPPLQSRPEVLLWGWWVALAPRPLRVPVLGGARAAGRARPVRTTTLTASSVATSARRSSPGCATWSNTTRHSTTAKSHTNVDSAGSGFRSKYSTR